MGTEGTQGGLSKPLRKRRSQVATSQQENIGETDGSSTSHPSQQRGEQDGFL